MTYQPSVAKIQAACCRHFRVKRNEMLSPRRYNGIAFPRQVAMYLARELTSYSFPQIGRAFGRDHSTIIHGARKIAEQLTQDSKLESDVAQLSAELKPQLPKLRSIFVRYYAEEYPL